jgi:SpoVK/Ycf46/Vps4 family AAA+-type ATPase
MTVKQIDEYIPSRFRREVVIHLFKNLQPRPDPAVPLILGIHGPSGEGKTYQCQRVLDELSMRTTLVSGGELENVNAGEPAKVVRQRYLDCALERGVHGTAGVCLVFNDLDAAIGDWGSLVQYTVNRQNIFGELMHLADYPHQVEGKVVPRVPIILTGNDFSKLYGPVVRPGRMRSFPWKPSPEERLGVLTRILPALAERELRELLREFPDQPVAFFAHVLTQLTDDVLWEHLTKIGVGAAFAHLSAGRQPTIPVIPTLEGMRKAGTEILQVSTMTNHLRS